MAKQATIELKNLTKEYVTHEGTGTFLAVDHINVVIESGQFVTLLGPSGCGKTTTLRMLAGFESVSEGDILLNGERINDMTPDRRDSSMVFQSYALFPHYDVFDNVGYGLVNKKLAKTVLREKVMAMLDLVGLKGLEHRLPNQLSGGQQQRVALAKIIAKSPDIILADEPTGNIDPEMSYEIVDLLNHINANGTTVVMVTHEHNLVRHFHHRVITIEQGAVVSDSEDTEALPDDYATIERDYASDASNAERAAAAAAAVQNIASSETVEDRVAKQKEDSISPFYVQPNSDADLEKFMATYGVDSDSSDDDVDYSKYLDAIEKKTGGDNR